jgi:hypothetical protein
MEIDCASETARCDIGVVLSGTESRKNLFGRLENQLIACV